MRKRQKFFTCKHCGNMVGLLETKGTPMICCGEKMPELIPNTTGAGAEKHAPVAAACKNRLVVKVGGLPHPMTSEHNIAFIYVETERGGQRKILKPGEEPKLSFSLVDDNPMAVFAYCNLHGLWKTEL